MCVKCVSELGIGGLTCTEGGCIGGLPRAHRGAVADG